MTGEPVATIVLSPVSIADLPAIVRIESLSVPRPWPLSAHRNELETNPQARHVAARLRTAKGAPPDESGGAIVGFGAMWLQADEAHVTMIAVHPDHRRRKIGQRLLVWLIREAIDNRARLMTLEVRARNAGAASMYAKFGFVEEGRRRGYYVDSGEDALIMTTPDFSDEPWRRRFQLLEAELS